MKNTRLLSLERLNLRANGNVSSEMFKCSTEIEYTFVFQLLEVFHRQEAYGTIIPRGGIA